MKHFFNDQIIIQYGIKNTLEDQVLKDVSVNITNLDSKSSNLKVSGVINLPPGDQISVKDVKENASGNEPIKFIYINLDTKSCQGEEALPAFKIQHGLNFTITEIDVDTQEEVGSYEEDYSLPDTVVLSADYLSGMFMPQG
jgi:hypothetical protein